MSIQKFITLFVLLACFWAHQTSAFEVTLNATSAAIYCNSTVCDIQDPLLWENFTTPSPDTNDTVHVYNPVDTPIYLFFNSSYEFLSFRVIGYVTLFQRANSSITSQNFTIGENATYVVDDYARIVSRENTWIVDGGKLDLRSHGAFGQDGTVFFLDNRSVVFVNDNSYVGLHSINAYILGQLVISEANSLFFSTGLIHFDRVTWTHFPNTPTIFNAIVYESTISFGQGINRLNGLILHNATVAIENNPPAIINNVTVDYLSHLAIGNSPNVTFIAPNITGALTVLTANLTIQGLPSVSVLNDLTVDSLSILHLRENLDVTLNDPKIAGTLRIGDSYVSIAGITSPPTPLVLNNVTVGHSSTLNFRLNPEVTLNFPFIFGTLRISSSNVRLVQSPSFNTPLILAGDADFTVDSLILRNVSFEAGETGENPNVNIMTNILHTFGTLNIPGELYVNVYAFFNDSISLTGGVTVTGEMHVESPIFTAGRPVNIGYSPMMKARADPFISVLNITGAATKYFSAPTIYIGDDAIFESSNAVITGNIEMFYNSSLWHHNTTYYSNVYSDGFVDVHGERTLHVIGNFTQGTQGTLIVHDLDLAGRSSGLLNVTGHANIAGNVLYSIKTQAQDDKRMQLLTISATNGVTGTFHADPTNIGPIANKAALLYTENDVYLVFGKEGGGGGGDNDIEWWVWLIVALGIVAVVGLIGLLYYSRRRRQGFSAVPSN